MGAGQTAGLGGGPSRQGLVGAGDVGACRSQRALAHRLVHVLDRLEDALAMASGHKKINSDSVFFGFCLCMETLKVSETHNATDMRKN